MAASEQISTYQSWQDSAEQLISNGLANQAFIDGEFCDAASGATFDCISPRNGQLLTRIAACDAEDVDKAVATARQAFDAGVWSGLMPKQRKKILQAFADELEAHADELALLESLDMGMTIRDSSTMNLPGAVECVNWYAELADKLYDEIAPTQPNALTRIHRVPVGVVAAIVPWNYPLMIACWKAAPALAAGNSVVLKPAEQSSLTAIRMAELAHKAGVPSGVFNVVPGMGDVAGKALGLHMDVDALAFTGSSRVGGLYMQYAGQSNLKRVALECGGKTPNIVLDDVEDLDKAAAAIVLGAFSNQGQICNAGSRLIVDRKVHQPLMDKVRILAEKIKPADPLDPATEFSCLVDARHTANVLRYIQAGNEAGAKLVCGGEQEAGDDCQCYLQATIFDNVSADMRIASEEIFGPVLSVIPVDSLEQAIAVANATVYGLGAAVWTRDMKRMEQAAHDIKAGVIWINCHDHGDISSPVGGFKQSGFGRDKSIHAMDKYVEYKTVWIDLS
ncbi:aldehyde dehydrogenase [Aliamphritea ceti]|uniref:aldehyde dehydrogenase n=1 Tax=Aliamphritea ceti TaxID=1524258 RepID=UPI0021C386F0|nr:aldehyde dehydrogenase [Aliamphritea ceti]